MALRLNGSGARGKPMRGEFGGRDDAQGPEYVVSITAIDFTTINPNG